MGTPVDHSSARVQKLTKNRDGLYSEH